MSATTRVSSDTIDAMVRVLVERFNPVQILLFGSHARGEAGPASDVDLLVVLDELPDKMATVVDMRRSLAPWSAAHDIVPTTEREIAERSRIVGDVIRSALRDGQVVFDRTAGSVTPRPGGPQAVADRRGGQVVSTRSAGPMTVEERRNEARRWLDHAAEDLQLACAPSTPPRSACAHAQQAAEKAVKAIYVAAAEDFAYRHELPALVAAVPLLDPAVGQVDADYQWLTAWYLRGRYPGNWPDATPDDSRRACGMAAAVVAAAERDVAAALER